MSDKSDMLAVRFAAMNFLAMREHSCKELQEKLARKFEDSLLIDAAIKVLTAEGLQSDSRFAEAFVAQRQRQAKGPRLIRLELESRGVAAEIIEARLDESAQCWYDLARHARLKKFGELSTLSPRDKAKQIRFLQARGFSSDQVYRSFLAE